jgi:plasmid stabilization system protein ParE
MTRSRSIKFFPAAETELKDAVAYYNRQCPGLGFEFAAEVRKTLTRILRFPSSWTQLSPRTRRCLTNRFPYAVIFQYDETHVFVVAVMHLKREPDSWKSNLSES